MRINLLYARLKMHGNKSKGYSCDVDAFIEIENIGFEKHVSILTPNQRSDAVELVPIASAEYQFPVGDKYECWRAQFNIELKAPTYDRPFALQFKYDDAVYWDNNDGRYYWIRYDYPRMFIQKGNVYLSEAHLDKNRFYGIVGVENIDYVKDIKVVYTLDKWASRTEISAQYIDDPQHTQMERKLNIDFFEFSSMLPEKSDPGQLEFFISYFVADRTYYDTNFGLNYHKDDIE